MKNHVIIYGDDEMNLHILYIYIYNYIYTYAAYIYHMVMMAGSSAPSALHPAAKSQCVGRAQRAWEGPPGLHQEQWELSLFTYVILYDWQFSGM